MGKAKDAFHRAARSGSERRKRSRVLTLRVSPQEAQAIEEMAASTGLTLSALLRNALLKTPPPRASRRLRGDQQTAARVLAALGKIGSNVNQLARQANMGREDLDIEELRMALRDLAELRHACLQALGYEREHDDEPTAD
jgi:Mobilization protein NikA